MIRFVTLFNINFDCMDRQTDRKRDTGRNLICVKFRQFIMYKGKVITNTNKLVPSFY